MQWAHMTVCIKEHILFNSWRIWEVFDCMCIRFLSLSPWGVVFLTWNVRYLLSSLPSYILCFAFMPKTQFISISALWDEACVFTDLTCIMWSFPDQEQDSKHTSLFDNAQLQSCSNGFWLFLSWAGCWWVKSFVACYQPLQFTSAK